jgi:transglutaminase-like putative cysteine protease
MQRRTFLKGAAILSASSLLNAAAVEQAKINAIGKTANGDKRRFSLSLNHDVIAPKGASGETKLWVALPEEAHFQQVRKIAFNGSYKEAYIEADNDYGAKTLFARWQNSQEKMTLNVEIVVDTIDWEPSKNGELKDYRPPKNIVYPVDAMRFLKPTAHVPIDGIVKANAAKIVGKEKNPLKIARTIYEWIGVNMFRDNAVIGCGVGDAQKTLEDGYLGGKCADISSVFVALLRASGVPAREMFGIRVGRANKLERYSKNAFGSADEKGLANISTAQHCRAQFYLADYGWVPCDPADVAKMRLAESKKQSDPDAQAVNEYLFGNWEMNWIGFNYARDFRLSPQTAAESINNFDYPYAEIGGKPLNYYDPKNFSYSYVSQERL